MLLIIDLVKDLMVFNKVFIIILHKLKQINVITLITYYVLFNMVLRSIALFNWCIDCLFDIIILTAAKNCSTAKS